MRTFADGAPKRDRIPFGVHGHITQTELTDGITDTIHVPPAKSFAVQKLVTNSSPKVGHLGTFLRWSEPEEQSRQRDLAF
jgi:hypothetical protein